jgi:hypothetical protein
MPCENYREALSEAAAIGSISSPQLRAHADSCAACRTFFNDEVRLFAAIDGTLQSKMNQDVPASLLPRVRARISEQPVSNGYWSSAWTALLTSAALAIGFFLLRGVEHHASPQQTERAEEARNITPAQSQLAPVPEHVHPSAPPIRKRVSRVAVKALPRASPPLVLVPPGQREIIDQLVNNLRRGEISGKELVAEANTPNPEIPPIAPVSVGFVQIKPLNPEDAKELR